MKCSYCSHEWQPRTPHPRKCPNCGNPVGQTPRRKMTGRYAPKLPDFGRFSPYNFKGGGF